jgi:hypothetical protein
MLSLRLAVAAGIAGICLWGLFQLLDNLKEPALLRSSQGIAVKGCSSLDAHADAPRLCPSFLCQKALVDRKLAVVATPVEITSDDTDGALRILEGRLADTDETFECIVEGVAVRSVEIVVFGESHSDTDALDETRID